VTYAAYIEVLIDGTTTPSLSDLTGTEFALQGATQVPPSELDMSLTVAPDPFCPGWTLGYTMRLTNTSAITLSNLVVNDTLPMGTCCLSNNPGSDTLAIYGAGANTATWAVGDLGAGDTLTLRYAIHTFTSLLDDSLVTNTMTFSSTELTESGLVSAGALADTSFCGATPSPTPTTPVYGVSIPLITK